MGQKLSAIRNKKNKKNDNCDNVDNRTNDPIRADHDHDNVKNAVQSFLTRVKTDLKEGYNEVDIREHRKYSLDNEQINDFLKAIIGEFPNNIYIKNEEYLFIYENGGTRRL